MADEPVVTNTEFLVQSVQSPMRVAADGLEVTGRSASDLIMLDRYTRANSSIARGFGALKFQQARPPSALGVQITYWR